MNPQQQAPQPLAPQQPYVPMPPSPEKKKMEKRFWIILITWLAAWPVSFVVSLVVHLAFLTNNDGSFGSSSNNPVLAATNVLAILLGIYGLLGWIPALIVGLKLKEIK